MAICKVGDKVTVLSSPYSSVKAGIVATVLEIRFAEFGKPFTIYILDTKPCATFKEHELKRID